MAWEKLVTFVTKVQNATKQLQHNNEKVQETCKEYLEQLDGELTTRNERKAVERIDEQLKEIKKDLERVLGKASDKVVIEFIGATSSGKSTLINALIKEERLPVGFVQTTMCLIEVCTTDKEDWSVTVNETMLLSNTRNRNEIKELLDAMSSNSLKEEREKLGIDKYSKVRVDWPKKFSSKVLPENVVLVDTPGLGMDGKCDQVVRDSCKKADITVAVISSTDPHIQCATELVKEVNCQYTFGIFTKWDKVIKKQEKKKRAISVDNVRKNYTEQYLEGVNSKEQRSTDDGIFFVDSLHVSENTGKEDSSPGVKEFQRFEEKLAEISSQKMKCQLLKGEVKAVAEKTEDVFEKFKKIVEKRRNDKLALLRKTSDTLEDGGKGFITICQNLKRSIHKDIDDISIKNLIEIFKNDIKTGNLSEEEAFKKLRDTINGKMNEIIQNGKTNANKEFKNWNGKMADVFPFSQCELLITESEIPQLNSEEMPNDKYNALFDLHSYYTNNYVMGALITATLGALTGGGFVARIGMKAAAAGAAALAGGGGGVPVGMSLTWFVKKSLDFGLGDKMKELEPISGKKMRCYNEYLAEECKKLIEDNKKLINNEIDRITKEKFCEVDRATSKTREERNELDMREHHLNKWSDKLDSRRREATKIRRSIDQLSCNFSNSKLRTAAKLFGLLLLGRRRRAFYMLLE